MKETGFMDKTIKMAVFFALFLPFLTPQEAIAVPKHKISSEIVSGVSAEGSCAVTGITAEECQLIALQRARANAIEYAAGIHVSSNTLVTNSRLAVDFIKSYSKGFIIKENVEWLPLSQYQKNKHSAPIPEYRVKIFADVAIPEKKIKPIGLSATLNTVVFRSGEKGILNIKSARSAKIAVFNITADDRVVMLFPNLYDKRNSIQPNKNFSFPPENSNTELVMKNIDGHKRDAEGFFVAAMDGAGDGDFENVFSYDAPMSLSEFFKKYSEIAEYCEDVIVAYEVVDAENR